MLSSVKPCGHKNRKRKQMTILVLCYIISHLIESRTFYVDSDAPPDGSGLSWFDAIDRLEIALSEATSNDYIYLRGNRTYIPHTSKRDECFNAPEGVFIYGGFTGNETEPLERPTQQQEFYLYASIISGNIGSTSTNLDNCYHVLIYNKIIQLDRIVIIEGNANYKYNGPETRDNLNNFGGALITNNMRESQNIVIISCVFRDNEAISGGALFFGSSPSISIIDNIVNIRITKTHFEGNKAFNGIFEGGYGGAIYVYNNVYLSITNTIFENNYAEFRGGAIYQDYGGTFVCSQCAFLNNLAAYGGGLFTENRYSNDGTFPQIGQNSIAGDNNALVYGGFAVALNDVDGGIQEMTFNKNTAGSNYNDGFGGANAIFWSDINDNTVTYNANEAINNPIYNNIYSEDEFLYTNVDNNLIVDLDIIMEDIWDLYNQKREQIDIFMDKIINPNVICYVNNVNIINGDGNSWENAFDNLQECLDKLSFSGGEIWVVGNGANSPYIPTIIPPLKKNVTEDIDKSFEMYDNIRMYGGFDGTETQRIDRNFYFNPTYLSGDIGNNKYVNNIIIAADNILIDGFYIINGGCSSNINDGYIGGGIYANQVEFNVVNCVFYKLCSNRVGGAIVCFGNGGSINLNIIKPILINVMFIGNTARLLGGAIYSEDECNIQCKWCNFNHNRASRRGGAVFLTKNSDIYFDSSRFISNNALESGGCVAVENLSNATFYCNKFVNNSARWEGGCLYAGTGDNIQIHTQEYYQGYISYGNTFDTTFIDNYLYDNNSDTYNNGQSDIYLWPYTDFIFYNEECSGTDIKPTPLPSNPPSIYMPMECYESRVGIYKNEIIELELIIKQDTNVIIKSCLSQFDTVLSLNDINGSEIIIADNGCENNDNAQIEMYNLVIGDYIILLDSQESIIGDIPWHVIVECPMITPPPQKKVKCFDKISGEFEQGNDIDFIFEQNLGNKVKVVFSTCESKNLDTKIFLKKENGSHISNCDNCGSDTISGDCGFCCNGNNQIAAQLTEKELEFGRYIVTLSNGNIGPYNGKYVLEFYCERITPQPTRPTQSPTPLTLPPTPYKSTTRSPTGPGRICCGEFIQGPYHDIDIWILFELDINSDIVIINTCESNFNTYIELWDKNKQILLSSANNGCENVLYNQSILIEEDMIIDSYYILLKQQSNNGINLPIDIKKQFELSIICIESTKTPTNPTLTTITTLQSLPTPSPIKPCDVKIECFETINGKYNNKPIIYEFDFYNFKDIEIETCGSDFDTRITILNNDLTQIIFGCETQFGLCQCNTCGNNTFNGNCLLNNNNIPPCCSNSIGKFEPFNAKLNNINFPQGKYFIKLDSPKFIDVGFENNNFKLNINCPNPLTNPPIPTSPPTNEPRILYCNDIEAGGFNNEDIIYPFILQNGYIKSTVIFNGCESDFNILLQLWKGNPPNKLISENNIKCIESNNNKGSILIVNNLLSDDDYFLIISSNNSIINNEPIIGFFKLEITCIPNKNNITIGPTLPPPPVTPSIKCGEIINGEYYGKKLYFEFNLIEPIIAIFDTCGSNFNTFIELRNSNLMKLYNYCNNCGTFNEPGDCSKKLNNNEICCNNYNNGSQNSALKWILNPGRYYYTIDIGNQNLLLLPQIIPLLYQITLYCLPGTMMPTSDINMTPQPTTTSMNTIMPTLSPITNTIIPNECINYCNAFSINVLNYNYSNNNESLCITYNVKRILSDGYYCFQNIRYIILGLCNGDSIFNDKLNGCSDNDLNGLLESFTIIYSTDSHSSDSNSDSSDSKDRRRRNLLQYSNKCFGINSDGIYGIMINIKINTEIIFEICLKNVFISPIKFSNIVKFRRGYNKYICDNNDWIIGLPCIDKNKFIGGGKDIYNDHGFNTHGLKYGHKLKKHKNRKNKGDSVENIIEFTDNNKLNSKNIIVKWEVLTCIILFGLCFITISIYCCILKRKKKEFIKNKRGEKIKSYEEDEEDDDDNYDESDNSLDGNNEINYENINTFKRIKYQNVNTIIDNQIEME